MDYLDRMGFTTVERELTDARRLPETVAAWTHRVEAGEMQIPVDGLVIAYDDNTLFIFSGSQHFRDGCFPGGPISRLLHLTRLCFRQSGLRCLRRDGA